MSEPACLACMHGTVMTCTSNIVLSCVRTAAMAIMRPSCPPPSTPTTAVRGRPLGLHV